METTAFQKIYTKITQITKATCSLKAEGVGYEEIATVNGRLAQVVKIQGDKDPGRQCNTSDIFRHGRHPDQRGSRFYG